MSKHKHLNCHELTEYRQKVWRARCESVEMGCMGFAACSLCKTYTPLGIIGAAERSAIQSTTESLGKIKQNSLVHSLIVSDRCGPDIHLSRAGCGLQAVIWGMAALGLSRLKANAAGTQVGQSSTRLRADV